MTNTTSCISDPALETYNLVQKVYSVLDAYSRSDLRSYGLTVPQFAILSYATAEGVPLSQISARMLCDNSNLTGIVDRLVTEGLVERHTSAEDRRVRLIKLTASGSELVRRISPRYNASINRRIRSLSDTQIEHLRQLLDELNSALQTCDNQPQVGGVAHQVEVGGRQGTLST